MDAAWGPLGGLSGTWEGDEGVDIAFGNVEGCEINTPFRERTTFNPFGPVVNGAQHLYGLDYRTAAWRAGEQDPFHTEVGYWLWDAAAGLVMRGFVVPRGSSVLAGGECTADAREFTMQAALGSTTFGILSNPYLDGAARCTTYECTVTVHDDAFRYEETTMIDLERTGGAFTHTDCNTLTRVG